jgi:hypothetical protein
MVWKKTDMVSLIGIREKPGRQHHPDCIEDACRLTPVWHETFGFISILQILFAD